MAAEKKKTEKSTDDLTFYVVDFPNGYYAAANDRNGKSGVDTHHERERQSQTDIAKHRKAKLSD